MGKLKTKSTNSDPVFYDVSSNHHQNIVNLCLMMNPPSWWENNPAPPRHPFFTTRSSKLARSNAQSPNMPQRDPNSTCPGISPHTGPLDPPGKFTFLNPKNEGGWFRWFSFSIGWFFMVSSFHLGGTYPTWQVGSLCHQCHQWYLEVS